MHGPILAERELLRKWGPPHNSGRELWGLYEMLDVFFATVVRCAHVP